MPPDGKALRQRMLKAKRSCEMPAWMVALHCKVYPRGDTSALFLCRNAAGVNHLDYWRCPYIRLEVSDPRAHATHTRHVLNDEDAAGVKALLDAWAAEPRVADALTCRFVSLELAGEESRLASLVTRLVAFCPPPDQNDGVDTPNRRGR